MTYIGIDVSKDTFVVAYSPEKTSKTRTFKEGFFRQMYRHRFCGQHPFARLQEPTHSYSQGIQRHSPKGEVLAGLVLRFQASSDLQRERGTA